MPPKAHRPPREAWPAAVRDAALIRIVADGALLRARRRITALLCLPCCADKAYVRAAGLGRAGARRARSKGCGRGTRVGLSDDGHRGSGQKDSREEGGEMHVVWRWTLFGREAKENQRIDKGGLETCIEEVAGALERMCVYTVDASILEPTDTSIYTIRASSPRHPDSFTMVRSRLNLRTQPHNRAVGAYR
jgi:hypothetical protein